MQNWWHEHATHIQKHKSTYLVGKKNIYKGVNFWRFANERKSCSRRGYKNLKQVSKHTTINWELEHRARVVVAPLTSLQQAPQHAAYNSIISTIIETKYPLTGF